MNITFLGAAQRVTGSNFLIDADKGKFLVDCGLFQGDVDANRQNWDDFLFNPSDIDFVVITHSHIDHIGRLPLLYKKGFRGKIYSTPPTKEFSNLFLEDSCQHLFDLAKELKLGPLYDQNDVKGVISLFETFNYYQKFEPKNGLKIKFYDAGHILGSAIIEADINGKIIVFSGDLGNPPVPILKDTDFITKADNIILESTYGNRNHEPYEQRKIKLERIIEDTINKKGTLLIPAFAMERTQEILYELNDLIETGKINKLPIFVDSPLAIKATLIYKKYPSLFDNEAKDLLRQNGDLFRFSSLKFIESVEQSKEIDQIPGPKIIIAGSGMSTGGRILFHEKRYLSEETTTLLTIGFQVKGTLGRALAEQTKTVNILGEEIVVKAKVEIIESYSAHADQERLLYWISKIQAGVKKIFLVHGEKQAQETLLHRINDKEGIETYIPKFGESVEI